MAEREEELLAGKGVNKIKSLTQQLSQTGIMLPGFFLTYVLITNMQLKMVYVTNNGS